MSARSRKKKASPKDEKAPLPGMSRKTGYLVMAVMVAVLFSGALLQFLGLTWMSTTAVLNQLPETFRGGTTVFATLRVVIVFGALTAASIITSLWVFRRKDL